MKAALWWAFRPWTRQASSSEEKIKMLSIGRTFFKVVRRRCKSSLVAAHDISLIRNIGISAHIDSGIHCSLYGICRQDYAQ